MVTSFFCAPSSMRVVFSTRCAAAFAIAPNAFKSMPAPAMCRYPTAKNGVAPTPISEPPLCPVRLKKRDGANPVASGPGHMGQIIGQSLTLGKGRPGEDGLKAAVSPRTRPFPEPAPRRG